MEVSSTFRRFARESYLILCSKLPEYIYQLVVVNFATQNYVDLRGDPRRKSRC